VSETINEIKAELLNVVNVQITAKVVTEKEGSPHLVTAVKFEYDGKPSAMEPILQLAAAGRPVFVKFYSPQLPLSSEEA